MPSVFIKHINRYSLINKRCNTFLNLKSRFGNVGLLVQEIGFTMVLNWQDFQQVKKGVDLAKMLKIIIPCYIKNIIVIMVHHTLHSLS